MKKYSNQEFKSFEIFLFHFIKIVVASALLLLGCVIKENYRVAFLLLSLLFLLSYVQDFFRKPAIYVYEVSFYSNEISFLYCIVGVLYKKVVVPINEIEIQEKKVFISKTRSSIALKIHHNGKYLFPIRKNLIGGWFEDYEDLKLEFNTN